jgi:predicted methyltransferase
MRMMHNLINWNIADSEIKAMRDLLKPDGLIGIEQHRAKADAPYSYTNGSKGYMREADIINFMEIHGFELVAKSEVNANPKDSANWPDGVWTLPPALRLKDVDRAKYEAIGETDRMTLLFKKRD